MAKPTPPGPGMSGDVVRDLHRRLDAVSFPVTGPEASDGFFGERTTSSLIGFQAERGLNQHGLLDEATSAALVEAGHRLGDRHLYLHSPMLRGDDIADLQLRLGSLGFDAGRIDGIFGPDTTGALLEFQRNTGLVPDGIAGPSTVRGLRNLGGRSADSTPVAQVRELEKLRRSGPELANRRMAIGHFGSSAVLTTALARSLRNRGAYVVALDHPDDSIQADTANQFDAEMYLGLRIENHPGCRIAYFETEGFRSEGGLRLAHRCAAALAGAGLDVAPAQGMRLPILRGTRMPAVLCSLAPPASVVQATAEVAEALAGAVVAWVADPAADPWALKGL